MGVHAAWCRNDFFNGVGGWSLGRAVLRAGPACPGAWRVYAGMSTHKDLLCANLGTTAALIAGGPRAGGIGAGRALRMVENFGHSGALVLFLVSSRYVLQVKLAAGAGRPSPPVFPWVPCERPFSLCARMPNKKFCAVPCGPLACGRARSFLPVPLYPGAEVGVLQCPVS